MPKTVHLIYFSPTGTTGRTCETVVQGLGASEVRRYDLTLPGTDIETTLTDGVAIIGIPVYSGRVPQLFLQRMQGITAKHVPTVLVALYGNRDFDDALVELCDLSVKKGFNVIAAGAFIGEHSFSTQTQPIAVGRPNAADLDRASYFGQQVAAKIKRGNLETPAVDGHVPYKERPKLDGKPPQINPLHCILCGKCAVVCPSGIIHVADVATTNAENCIMCCACVRVCENEALTFTHTWMEEKRAFLYQNCRVPLDPKLFL